MSFSPETKRLLVVDRPGELRERVVRVLGDAGFQVDAVAGAAEAQDRLARRHHDAILLALPAGLGGELPGLLRPLARRAPTTPIVLLCDPSEVRAAVLALRHGVEDYLLRPPDPFELRTRLQRILERHDLDSHISYYQDELAKKSGANRFEVRSPSMRSVLDRLLRVAPLRSTVLIYGESGVGKELVARSVHLNSPRSGRPFIALNCAAIAPSLIESELFGHEKGAFTGAHARFRGKFEIAHGGTLFLDEIGEMDAGTQAKLLRVLEEREFMRIGGDHSIRVDVRVLAATNADLEAMIADGRFRRDLYYRLKVVTIRVPPLRERRADIASLVDTFLDRLASENAVLRKAIDPDAMAALEDYAWPGNVRELKNILESLLVSVAGERVRLADLPDYVRRESSAAGGDPLEPGTTLAEMERELIRRTLHHTGGNRTHSATLLGIGVRTLQRKIRTYGIRIAPRRRGPRRAS